VTALPESGPNPSLNSCPHFGAILDINREVVPKSSPCNFLTRVIPAWKGYPGMKIREMTMGIQNVQNAEQALGIPG